MFVYVFVFNLILLFCYNCLVLFFVFLTLMYRSVLLLLLRNTDGFRALAFMLHGCVSLSCAVSMEFQTPDSCILAGLIDLLCLGSVCLILC